MAAAEAYPARARDVEWRHYLGRIAQGDQHALATFYDESSSLVYALALRILGDAADAEEATLDVYTQVWRTAATFDAARASAASWLAMLARSRAIDRLRSGAGRRREEPLDELRPLPAGEEHPEEASFLSQRRRLVHAALQALSPEQRQAIELAFFSDLSHTELAARLGQPLGTVKTRIRLGMMKLRTLLAGVDA
jgi:RNA polymerase sigma-70 factor (ECF subfamily)